MGIGVRTGVPAFYVSFLLAPLASNASELLASMYYAGKKTQTSITISFAALEGAACMNNTFCLAIFMGLVYFKGIAWQYTAETLSIVFVQLAVAVFARKGTLTPVDGAHPRYLPALRRHGRGSGGDGLRLGLPPSRVNSVLEK